MEGQPIPEIRVGNLDVKDVFFAADIKGRLEPGFIAVLVNFFFDVLEELQPTVKFFFILHRRSLDFHRNFHNCGKTFRFCWGTSAKARKA
jgi:hypothetical protein